MAAIVANTAKNTTAPVIKRTPRSSIRRTPLLNFNVCSIMHAVSNMEITFS